MATHVRLPAAKPNVNTLTTLAKKEESIDLNDDQSDSVREQVYLDYEHHDWSPGCKPHPGRLVESASLAAVNVPIDTYRAYSVVESLPPGAVSEGKLSSLQLESVIKAAHRHQKILPNGERAGFFIGDAAGVGKGRQIAAIITDNYSRGRARSVWFSVSTDLIIDARRDLTDIGSYINIIDGCQQIDKGTKLFGLSESVKTGVVFSTYSTLVSAALHGNGINQVKMSRLAQLIHWCGGPEFDGCLVFDECHKAKNFIPGNENSSSKVALAVCALQQALPRARVVYCSATGVSDVKNMAFMQRLGLWGEGASFKSYEEFLEMVQRKGLGIAEMLAMDMKREGIYVSRMLSYNDTVFSNVESPLTEDQKALYNEAVEVWNEVRRNLRIAIRKCHIVRTQIWVQYWASHQRFFQQLCMSMKVDTVVEMSKEALNNNQCIIIGLQNTGEAGTEKAMEREGSKFTGFVSSCREVLINFLVNWFPTRVENQTSNGIPLPTTPTEVIYDDWSRNTKSDIIKYVKNMNLPATALDWLIDRLGGPTKVAEMTGRKVRMVRAGINKRILCEVRQSPSGCVSDQSLNVRERTAFMDGRKLVAIISDAASTGISLHADAKCKNQRQRVHITLQLPWSADKAVQQLGRSHRSNQTSGPMYKILVTELGGERRFAASVAKRLQTLGALTKGDRRAATAADLSEFNYDTQYGRTALRLLYLSITQGRLPASVTLDQVCNTPIEEQELFASLKECVVMMGLQTEDESVAGRPISDNDSRDVSRFLNRILGLQVFLQNTIFQFFTRCLDIIVETAKKEGKFNDGFVDLSGNCIQKKRERVVFTSLCKGCKEMTLSVDRGMSWEDALHRFDELNGDNKLSGFYETRHAMNGRYFYMLITPKDSNNHHTYRIARPNTGVTIQEVDRVDISMRYVKISQEMAEKHWKESFETSLDQCNHREHCNQPGTCQVVMRRYTVNIVCGSLLKILPLLEDVLVKHSYLYKISKYDAMAKVVRVCLESGERLIGFQFPAILMGVAHKVANERLAEKKAQALLSGQVNQSREATEQTKPIILKYTKKAFSPPITLFTYFKQGTTCDPFAPGNPPDSNDDVLLVDRHDLRHVVQAAVKPVSGSGGTNTQMKKEQKMSTFSDPEGLVNVKLELSIPKDLPSSDENRPIVDSETCAAADVTCNSSHLVNEEKPPVSTVQPDSIQSNQDSCASALQTLPVISNGDSSRAAAAAGNEEGDDDDLIIVSYTPATKKRRFRLNNMINSKRDNDQN